MSQLEDIKARAEDALLHQNLDPSVFAELAWTAVEQMPKLIAALEAVEKLLDEKYKLFAAVCGETCLKEIFGVDHEAIADNIATKIHAAITEALR